jgi:hypothetical protein
MLNYFDKVGMTLVAAGILGQFFTPGTDTALRGCTAVHQSTGTWLLTLPVGIDKPNYLCLFGALTGYSPGITVGMTDASSTQKFVLIKDSNTGAPINVDMSFMLFELEAQP